MTDFTPPIDPQRVFTVGMRIRWSDERGGDRPVREWDAVVTAVSTTSVTSREAVSGSHRTFRWWTDERQWTCGRMHIVIPLETT